MNDTRRRLLGFLATAPAVIALPGPLYAAPAMPAEWAKLALEAEAWFPQAHRTEIHETVARAFAAGLPLADFNGFHCGTRARPYPFCMFFGDWEAGAYSVAQAARVMRYERLYDGWNTNEPHGEAQATAKG